MRHLIALLLVLLVVSASLVAAAPVLAAPPAQDGTDGDNGDGGGGGGDGGGTDDGGSPDEGGGGGIGDVVTTVVNSIIKHIIYFPVESMKKAVEGILAAIIEDNIEQMAEPFDSVLGTVLTTQPQIKGGDALWGGDIFEPTWRLTIQVAIALWPAMLALMALVGAKDAVLSAEWGLRDLKDVLFAWLTGAVAAGASLEAIHLATRGANAVADAILVAGVRPDVTMDVGVLKAALVTGVLAIGLGPATLFVVLIMAIVGFVLLVSLLFQYVARFALLFILTGMAPIAFTLGILPPLRWLQGMWLKGLVLTLLIGPANALLLKLAVVAAMAAVTLQGGALGAILRFFVVGGVISVLLAINYTLIRSVFGALAVTVDRVLHLAAGVRDQALGAAVMAGTAGAGAGALGAAGGGGGAATRAAGGFMQALGGGQARAAWQGAAPEERDAAAGRFWSALGGAMRRSRSGGLRAAGEVVGAAGESSSDAAARRRYAQAQRQQELGALNQTFERGSQYVGEQYRRTNGGGLDRGALEEAKTRAYAPIRQAFDQGQSITAQARQAGFSRPEAYVASRVEANTSDILRGGFGNRVFDQPDLHTSTTPAAGARPDRLDFEQGHQLARGLRISADHAPGLASIHHGLRAHAVNPEAGYRAAQAFAGDLAGLESGPDLGRRAAEVLDRHAQAAGVTQPALLADWRAAIGRIQ